MRLCDPIRGTNRIKKNRNPKSEEREAIWDSATEQEGTLKVAESSKLLKRIGGKEI